MVGDQAIRQRSWNTTPFVGRSRRQVAVGLLQSHNGGAEQVGSVLTLPRCAGEGLASPAQTG